LGAPFNQKKRDEAFQGAWTSEKGGVQRVYGGRHNRYGDSARKEKAPLPWGAHSLKREREESDL